jgi:hypothetical protein
MPTSYFCRDGLFYLTGREVASGAQQRKTPQRGEGAGKKGALSRANGGWLEVSAVA